MISLNPLTPDVLVLLAGAPNVFREGLSFQYCPEGTPRNEFPVMIRLKLLQEDVITALVDLFLMIQAKKALHLRPNRVNYVISYRADLLMSDGLCQLLQHSSIPLSVNSECHSADEADGEEGKELAELPLFYLSENSRA